MSKVVAAVVVVVVVREFALVVVVRAPALVVVVVGEFELVVTVLTASSEISSSVGKGLKAKDAGAGTLGLAACNWCIAFNNCWSIPSRFCFKFSDIA